jgi:tetratricopeptide (TPR) repeat protein
MISRHLKILSFVLITVLIQSCRHQNSGSLQIDSESAGTPEILQLNGKIRENPKDASLYAARGVLWYDYHNFDQGISDMEKAISMDSSKAEYFHTLADMYLDYVKSRQGLNTMLRASKLFPGRIPTLLKLSEFQYILKQYNDALFTLERIRQIDPMNAEMFFMFGRIFEEMNKTEQAANAYQSAVENDTDLVDAWIKLAQILANKKSPLAGKYFDNALNADPNSIEALHAKAYYLSNSKNDLPGAIALYKQINVLDPQYEDGYFNAGLIYLDMDSVKAAFQNFDMAIKVAPTFSDAYRYRGIAAEKMGKTEQAKTDYEMAEKLSTPKVVN